MNIDIGKKKCNIRNVILHVLPAYWFIVDEHKYMMFLTYKCPHPEDLYFVFLSGFISVDQ